MRVEELQPGHVVHAVIKRLLGDGLVLEFAKVYQGVVHHSHLDQILAESWSSEYEVGQQVMARIVCINPTEKRIALSLKGHLLDQHETVWLRKCIKYSKEVPRECEEVITADVRRLAYGQVYLYTKLLDPGYLYKERPPWDQRTAEDDEREELLRAFPAKCEEKLKYLVPIRVSVKLCIDCVHWACCVEERFSVEIT